MRSYENRLKQMEKRTSVAWTRWLHALTVEQLEAYLEAVELDLRRNGWKDQEVTAAHNEPELHLSS